MPESAATTNTWLLSIYGSLQVYASSRPFMVKPFQMQSMVPELNSISFASHAIGCGTNSRPSLSATSFASSRSKPVYSPSSPTKPIGGKSWSKPTVKVPPSSPASSAASAVVSSAVLSSAEVSASVAAAVVSAGLLPPHAVMDTTIIPAIAALNILFLIIFLLTNNTHFAMTLSLYTFREHVTMVAY